jgi:hypothetical protein
MKNPASFASAAISLGSQTNGIKTSYTFTLVARTPIVPFDWIKITFPEECVLPPLLNESFCSLGNSRFVSNVGCSLSSNDKQEVLISLSNIQRIDQLTEF